MIKYSCNARNPTKDKETIQALVDAAYISEDQQRQYFESFSTCICGGKLSDDDCYLLHLLLAKADSKGEVNTVGFWVCPHSDCARSGEEYSLNSVSLVKCRNGHSVELDTPDEYGFRRSRLEGSKFYHIYRMYKEGNDLFWLCHKCGLRKPQLLPKQHGCWF